MSKTPSEEELDEFRNQVLSWVTLDDQIRKLKIAAKERKKAQTVLSQTIMKFMEEHEIDDLNTQYGKIKFCKKNVIKPVTLNEIRDQLEKNSDKTAEEIAKELFAEEKRPKTTKAILHRVVPKVTMCLDI